MRNRLWLERALFLLDWGIFCTAGLLVAAATIHVFFVALSWRYGMGLAVMPIFMALLAGTLYRRPSAATAALASDRRFDCREIFISALEQTTVPPNERLGASNYLLDKAEERAADLVRQAWPWFWRFSARRSVPLALALSGIFLLMSPGAMIQFSRSQSVTVTPEAPPSRQSAEDETSAAYRLRQEIEKLALAMQRSEEPGPSGAVAPPDPSSPTTASLANPDRETADPGDPAPLGRAALGRVALGQGDEKAPTTTVDESTTEDPATFSKAPHGTAGGDTAGHRTDLASMPSETAGDPNLSVRPINIDRRSGDSAEGKARPLVFSEMGLSSLAHEDKGPAATDGSAEVGYEVWFQPSLRAYAQAYLARLQQAPSP